MKPLDVVTLGFGLSNYYWYNGEKEKSNALIDRILEVGDSSGCYVAFGYLACKSRQDQPCESLIILKRGYCYGN